MEENVTRIRYREKEIILIATAHVSQQSAELVKQVINTEQPDSVCVELDEDRFKNVQNPDAWKNTDIVQVIKSKKVGFLIANLFLSSYQKRIAKKLNTIVGQEMIQGINSAEEQGARLVLADRKIQVTFLRIWRKLSLWEKLKLLFSAIFSFGDDTEISEEDLQELLQADMLESAMADIHKQFPKIGEILVTERDQYLAYQIKNAPGEKVVAVLGGAHVPGVSAELDKEQDIQRISEIPPRTLFAKAAGWLIPALIVGLFVYAFAINLETGLQQLQAWVLWNGALAALFTLLAMGHPLSILTAFCTAPFTTLNPLIACGWFTGLVEAILKKPTVEDVENVPTDIFSFKGFFKNRFLKIILVVIFANLGSSLGTIVAGMDIITNLFG